MCVCVCVCVCVCLCVCVCVYVCVCVFENSTNFVAHQTKSYILKEREKTFLHHVKENSTRISTFNQQYFSKPVVHIGKLFS